MQKMSALETFHGAINNVATNISDKITIEKTLLDIDCKITQIHDRFHYSANKAATYAIEFPNQHMQSTGSSNVIYEQFQPNLLTHSLQ